jgi:uncharacterized membrane protein
MGNPDQGKALPENGGMGFKALVKKAYRRYLLDAMSAMALGLFSSLIIGLILAQLAKIPGLQFLSAFSSVLGAASPVVGAAIGVAIAHGLKSVPLAVFSSAATGALGYQLGGTVARLLRRGGRRGAWHAWSLRRKPGWTSSRCRS